MTHAHDFFGTVRNRRLVTLVTVTLAALGISGGLSPARGQTATQAPQYWVPVTSPAAPAPTGALVPGTHYVVGPDGTLVPVQISPAPQATFVQAPVVVAQAPAPALTAAQIRARCEHYAYATRRDNGRIVKNGLFGAALGAGMGAAIGAIADGGSGAGKGAGIGAIAGVAGGSLYGYDKESRRADQARQAYHSCLARYGL